MAEKQHYLKLGENLREYIPDSIGHVDWRRRVFADITENGTCLTIEPLPPTRTGLPRIGLCGDDCFCEAGIDRTRPDSIFVYRLVAADDHEHRTPPQRYSGQFHLLADHQGAPNLDSVAHLFPVRERAAPLSLGDELRSTLMSVPGRGHGLRRPGGDSIQQARPAERGQHPRQDRPRKSPLLKSPRLPSDHRQPNPETRKQPKSRLSSRHCATARPGSGRQRDHARQVFQVSTPPGSHSRPYARIRLDGP